MSEITDRMKLHIFGSCAGTEPMPERHHTAWALETGGGLYWFDAGETCSYTAHLMGLELLSVRAVFISHTHMDHIGGIGNLFWNIRKLSVVKNQQPGDIELFIPNLSSWEAILALLKNTEGNFRCNFAINAHGVNDGIIFDDGAVRVEALHNLHLGDSLPWRSFSYRIFSGGKRIVYSGDIRDSSDLDAFLSDGCDYLLIETGHHSPDVIARYIKEKGYEVGELLYIHSGRDILESRERASELIGSVRDGGFRICEDGQTIQIN